MDPDPQNRARSAGPGPGVLPDTEEETEVSPPDSDPDKWGEPNFNPGQRPRVDPDPQNNWFKRAMGAAGWHDDTNSGVKRTWDAIAAGNDPHRNHATQTEFFRQHAHDLAMASSHHGVRSLQEAGATPNMNSVMTAMQQLFGQLMGFEAAHKAQLERLAEAIAAKKLGLPKEMFKAELVTAGGDIQNNPHEHGRKQDEVQQDMGEENLDAVDVGDAIEAQIPMQEIPHIATVLLPKRAIEFVFFQELLFNRRRDFSFSVKRPAWGNTDQQECDGDNGKHHHGQ